MLKILKLDINKLSLFFFILIIVQVSSLRNILIASLTSNINDLNIIFDANYQSFLLGFSSEIIACDSATICNLSFYIYENISITTEDIPNDISLFSDRVYTNLIIRSYWNDSKALISLTINLCLFEFSGKVRFENIIFHGSNLKTSEIIGFNDSLACTSENNSTNDCIVTTYYIWPKSSQIKAFINIKNGSDIEFHNCEFEDFYFFRAEQNAQNSSKLYFHQ